MIRLWLSVSSVLHVSHVGLAMRNSSASWVCPIRRRVLQDYFFTYIVFVVWMQYLDCAIRCPKGIVNKLTPWIVPVLSCYPYMWNIFTQSNHRNNIAKSNPFQTLGKNWRWRIVVWRIYPRMNVFAADSWLNLIQIGQKW